MSLNWQAESSLTLSYKTVIPMSLLLTVYNSPHWKTFAENCGLPLINEATPQINTAIAVLQPTQSLSTLSAMLSGLAIEQTLWLAVVQAEYFLADAVEYGGALAAAAQLWTQQTKALLDLQRQQRRKLQLFNLHQALANPSQFQQLLKVDLTNGNYVEPIDTCNVSLLAASQYLAQHPELQALNTLLQASVLPLCDSEVLTLNIEQILLHNRSLLAATQERDLALSQLHHVQQELELGQQANKAELDAANQTQAKLQLELEQEIAAKSAAQQECNLVLSQLHHVQEELESSYLSNKSALDIANQTQAKLQLEIEQETAAKNATKHTILQLEADLKKATTEHGKLYQQLEKVTAEKGAALQKKARAEANYQSSSEERDLILTQLHQVQEQLEQYYLTLQTEQQQHKHALLARDKQHTKETAKLESELRKTKARASSAEYAGQLLQQELEKLRSSISWKAAKPVRVIGRMLKKNKSANDKIMQDIGLLLTSEYFDVDWYLRTYTDVAESQMNPAEHYLIYGAAEGRLPGPLFDGNWYLQHYPDVAESNINPLLHFIMFGQQEGRSSSPKLLTNSIENEESNNG